MAVVLMEQQILAEAEAEAAADSSLVVQAL
jgi:hypothetical protein